jgi:hypothetical protein
VGEGEWIFGMNTDIHDVIISPPFSVFENGGDARRAEGV